MENRPFSPQVSVYINANRNSIPMGKTIQVAARLDAGGDALKGGFLLLPFVNGRRWGAHERPDAQGKALFSLPLPNLGPARIQVIAVTRDSDDWVGLKDGDILLAGRPLPQQGVRSNMVEVEVTRRAFPARTPSETLFGMQWEPWFTGGWKRWRTTQAVPVFGFYDSYDRDVTRQHILWFMDLGVDFIFPDWTNHLWGKQHWDERSDYVNTLVHATTLTLETLAEMRQEGLPVPKLVLFPGLSNGRPCSMQALNEQFDWIYHNYLRNPRFDGLWLDFEGKPLIVVLDTGAVGDKRGTAESAFRIPFFKQTLEMSEAELDEFRQAQPQVDDSHFTVRWMSSQNQTTRHHELGFWSWMDGVIDPPVTYKDGKAEAVTVTPSFFNAYGWTDESQAYGRRGGATYLDTFKVALEYRPKVVFLHQWNEYSGQAEGHGMGPDHNIYVDTFSVELSDDLEPVSPTAPGYRGDQGGWGYYYLNLTRALIDLYRGKASDCTFLAVSSPLRGAKVTGETLKVSWSVLGAPAESFSIAIDGKTVAEKIHGSEAEVSLVRLSKGPHTLTVFADGATTRYALSWTEPDDLMPKPSEGGKPMKFPYPVQADVPFVIE